VWKDTSYFRILILATIYSAYMVIFVLFKQTTEQGIMKKEQAILTVKMDAMNAYLSELKKCSEHGRNLSA
jgi:glycopeptide antibiotics resistance protein